MISDIFTDEQYYYLKDTYVGKDKYYEQQEKIIQKQSEISEQLARTQEQLTAQKGSSDRTISLVMFILSAVIGIYTLLAK